MWLLFNHYRKEGKLLVTEAAIKCILLLMVVEVLIVAITKTLLNPWVASVGLVWILTTAYVLWSKGGLEIDTLIAARLFSQKRGEKIADAIIAVFLIQALIVVFALVVPMWESWTLFLSLLVFLVGAIIATFAVKKPLMWKEYSYNVLWIGVGVLLVAIFVSFISGGMSLNRGDFFMNKLGFKIFVSGLVILGLGLIPKIPLKKVLFFIGFLTILGSAGVYVFGQDIKSAIGAIDTTTTTTSGPTETLKLSELRTNGGPDTLMVGEGLRITPKNPNRPKPLGAMFVTPDGNKYYFWGNNDPQKENWLINNFGPKKEYLVKLELPRGLMLDDLILELQTASAKQHPRTRTRAKQIIQPRPDNRNKTEEGELPKNLEIIS